MRELALNNCRIERRYDTREQLGRGSYAEIYLARDILASPQSPHGLVVLKALNVFLQNDLDADLERTLVENFQNEAVALDRVRHPNIISRLGHGTSRDLSGTVFHYLVLEYMPGGDLQSRVRRRKLAPQEAIDLIEQICAGLSHAHERGVIHRDIKPQNLLLSADHSTVKIADFGVARSRNVDSPITRVGTNIYAPPEHSPLKVCVDDDGAQLTPAADVYSLAKTVYTLLTGEAPRAFASQPITSLPEFVSGEEWADALLAVLTKATSDAPAERQQSVDEFWTDLAVVRSIVAEGEYVTVLKTEAESAPQPHVARGYSPIAPTQPSFQGVRAPQPTYTRPAYVPPPVGNAQAATRPGSPQLSSNQPTISPYMERTTSIANSTGAAPAKKKRRTIRRLATFAVFFAIFGGALYGTASYMRGRGMIPAVTNPFAQTKTAVANTDIYLRPTPSTDNDPIGLVTKNSRVRIVNSRDNWYQVDVVEQGRVRPSATNATRGWLNGKYIDISQN